MVIFDINKNVIGINIFVLSFINQYFKLIITSYYLNGVNIY